MTCCWLASATSMKSATASGFWNCAFPLGEEPRPSSKLCGTSVLKIDRWTQYCTGRLCVKQPLPERSSALAKSAAVPMIDASYQLPSPDSVRTAMQRCNCGKIREGRGCIALLQELFVTGDYAVGGVGLQGRGRNGFATGSISVSRYWPRPTFSQPFCTTRRWSIRRVRARREPNSVIPTFRRG